MGDNNFRSLEVALANANISDEFSSSLVETIRSDNDFVEHIPPPGSFGAIVGRYVIRSDDADFIALICDAVETAASVGVFVGTATADAIVAAKVSLAVSLFKLMHSLGTKGAILTNEELQILLAIRANDKGKGVALSELSSFLGKDPSDLTEMLNRLSDYPLNKSVTKAFVESYGDAWRTKV